MRRTLVPIINTPPLPPALGSVVHALRGETMGTTWSVKLVSHANRNLPALQKAIQRELDLVVAQMSTWAHDSSLTRFNQAAAGSWHVLPDAFWRVLTAALQVARDSNGAYDPTAGALVNLWGFGPVNRYNEAGFTAPAQQAVEAARQGGGWQRLAVDVERQRIQQPGTMYLDLSAIAKGFGVDQVARRLLQLGLDSFLVEVGGELRGEGIKPDGQPWWAALEQPLPMLASTDISAQTQVETLAALYGCSVATSGDYRRYFDEGQQRFSHTIDPRTGMPITHGLASVTVLHHECMLADAWSTALGVLGEDEGIACADRFGLSALFVTRTANGLQERMSTAMKALLA